MQRQWLVRLLELHSNELRVEEEDIVVNMLAEPEGNFDKFFARADKALNSACQEHKAIYKAARSFNLAVKHTLYPKAKGVFTGSKFLTKTVD